MRASRVALMCGCVTALALGGESPFSFQTQLETARGLDIDYRKCAAVVLSDQIRQLTNSDTAYISIFGEDPDSATLASLRRVHPRTALGSKAPSISAKHTHNWLFNFFDLHAVASEEYAAQAGFYCGRLCADAKEYRLKKDGDSCAVISSNILWQS